MIQSASLMHTTILTVSAAIIAAYTRVSCVYIRSIAPYCAEITRASRVSLTREYKKMHLKNYTKILHCACKILQAEFRVIEG